MEEKVIAYFSRFMPLSVEEKDAIVSSIETQTFSKATLLLQEGQIPKDNYWVIQGCVQQYYLSDGKEITSNFYTEEQWILTSDSSSTDSPSKYFLQCVEPTTLLIGNNEKGNQMIQAFPKFGDLSRLILEQEIIRQQNDMANFITQTPEQRYLQIMQSRPDLINRVPQYQLASYIGVQPESLSRIRKRLAGQ